MGLKIVDLLRWRGSVELKDTDGKPILYDKKPVTVYVRVIGDQDLQNAYKVARVHSAEARKKLRDHESLEFKDQVEPIREATKEECIELILTAREQNFGSDAYANTERPELVRLEEIAVDPDAPTLEEQEKLDATNEKVEQDFQNALKEYVETKKVSTKEELENTELEELRRLTELEVSNITSLGLFLQTVQDYKMIYACYNDKTYRERSFDSIEEWRETPTVIKDQLLAMYSKLEQGSEDIKN